AEPTMLMLDEITAALPADLSERVFRIVRRWREARNTGIFISHRVAEVVALCDRATVLRDGATVGVTDTSPGSEDRIVSLMLGQGASAVASAKEHVPNATATVSERTPALEVRSLHYGNIVNGISFSLRQGEVLGVAALEGQGQQELFDC